MILSVQFYSNNQSAFAAVIETWDQVCNVKLTSCICIEMARDQIQGSSVVKHYIREEHALAGH